MSAPGQGDLGRQVLALVVFVFALWAQSPGAYPGVADEGLYLVVAKALVRGQGLHFIHQPDAPAAAFLPPLFPVIAGAIGFVFPDFPANLLLVQILNAALLAGAAWFAAGLGRSLPVRPAAWYAIVALGFVNVAVLSTGVRVVPEPLLLFWWFAGFASVRAVERNSRWAFAAGTIGAAAVLTAHTGVALLVGLVGGLLLRGHRAASAVAGGVAAIVIAPWLAWSLAHDRPAVVAGSIEMALSNVSPSWTDAVRLVDPGGGVVAAVVMAGVVLTAALGVWWTWRAVPEWTIALAAHLVVLAVVPITQRSVWVLFPSIVLLAAFGVHTTRDAQPRLRGPIAAAATLATVIIVWLNGAALVDRRFIPETTEAGQELIRQFIEGVGTETPARAVIATDADALLYLHTERSTLPLIEGMDGGGGYCAQGAEYLALSGLRPAREQATPPNAQRVFALTDGPALYRLACD